VSVALLRDLAAAPRPTGSDAIATARARVARELTALGFQVRERPFEYSAFPGHYATPLLGAAMLLLVGTAGHLGSRGERWWPLAIVIVGGFVAKFAAEWVARRGVLVMPLMRARGVNLQATKPDREGGGAEPAIWLCAHIDTKSQPVPTLLRVAGLVLSAVGYNATIVLAIVAAAGKSAHLFWWAAAALVTLAGCVPVVMSVVTSRSPGALDNASGVATVVEAARSVGDADVGVLITDAEELGLAGARAWAAERSAVVVLNCDGVDDAGEIVVVLGRAPGAIAATLPAGTRTRKRIPGVMTDAIAFADAGLASVTFMRGGWSSFARVHSRTDDLAHLAGTGIADVAGLMAATARLLGAHR
jgi:acetylornithine deacetylase/succinyl-diaminopimelate desuccinylase-like protein